MTDQQPQKEKSGLVGLLEFLKEKELRNKSEEYEKKQHEKEKEELYKRIEETLTISESNPNNNNNHIHKIAKLDNDNDVKKLYEQKEFLIETSNESQLPNDPKNGFISINTRFLPFSVSQALAERIIPFQKEILEHIKVYNKKSFAHKLSKHRNLLVCDFPVYTSSLSLLISLEMQPAVCSGLGYFMWLYIYIEYIKIGRIFPSNQSTLVSYLEKNTIYSEELDEFINPEKGYIELHSSQGYIELQKCVNAIRKKDIKTETKSCIIVNIIASIKLIVSIHPKMFQLLDQKPVTIETVIEKELNKYEEFKLNFDNSLIEELSTVSENRDKRQLFKLQMYLHNYTINIIRIYENIIIKLLVSVIPTIHENAFLIKETIVKESHVPDYVNISVISNNNENFKNLYEFINKKKRTTNIFEYERGFYINWEQIDLLKQFSQLKRT